MLYKQCRTITWYVYHRDGEVRMAEGTMMNRGLAERALELVTAHINDVLASGLCKRSALAVVVLDGEGDIIATANFGEQSPEDYEFPYGKIALGKARLALRTRMDTGEVIATAPHLLEHGDPVFEGGVYFRGIAVGTSGVQSEIDEMISAAVADAMIMLAKLQLRSKILPSGENFIADVHLPR